jgi:hypothetical protein
LANRAGHATKLLSPAALTFSLARKSLQRAKQESSPTELFETFAKKIQGTITRSCNHVKKERVPSLSFIQCFECSCIVHIIARDGGITMHALAMSA